MKFRFKIDGDCEVTQLNNGKASHKGSKAWDICSRTKPSNLGYSCNVEVECKHVNQRYAFVWWQTVDKVELPNGEVDYLTFMTGHDNVINAYVGLRVPPGVRLGNMGTGGNATGSHLHLEFGQGKYQGNWYSNAEGVYVIYNSIYVTEATFMDDMPLLTPTKYTDVINRWDSIVPLFKYDEDESLQTQVEILNKKLNIATHKLDEIRKILGD